MNQNGSTNWKLTANAMVALGSKGICPGCGRGVRVLQHDQVACLTCKLVWGTADELQERAYAATATVGKGTSTYTVQAFPLNEAALPQDARAGGLKVVSPAESNPLETPDKAAELLLKLGFTEEQLSRDTDGNVTLTQEQALALKCYRAEEQLEALLAMQKDFTGFCREPVLLMARAMEITLRADEPVRTGDEQWPPMLFWREMNLADLYKALKALTAEVGQQANRYRARPPVQNDKRAGPMLMAAARVAACAMMIADKSFALALAIPEEIREAGRKQTP